MFFVSFLCLKMTPISDAKISGEEKVTIVLWCSFKLNLTDISFTLTETSLK